MLSLFLSVWVSVHISVCPTNLIPLNKTHCANYAIGNSMLMASDFSWLTSRQDRYFTNEVFDIMQCMHTYSQAWAHPIATLTPTPNPYFLCINLPDTLKNTSYVIHTHAHTHTHTHHMAGLRPAPHMPPPHIFDFLCVQTYVKLIEHFENFCFYVIHVQTHRHWYYLEKVSKIDSYLCKIELCYCCVKNWPYLMALLALFPSNYGFIN